MPKNKAEPIANWLGDEKRVEAIFGPGSPTVDDVRAVMSTWLDEASSVLDYLDKNNIDHGPSSGWQAYFGAQLRTVCQSLRPASAGTSLDVLFVVVVCCMATGVCVSASRGKVRTLSASHVRRMSGVMWLEEVALGFVLLFQALRHG